jgi:TolB-like protein/Tfp pilus assembly protein PilF
MTSNSDPGPGQRLDSWKEIASFFGRAERTVKRWETERGLPIHRVPGSGGGRVFAYARELEAWLAGPNADLGQQEADESAEASGEPVDIQEPASTQRQPWPSGLIAAMKERWKVALLVVAASFTVAVLTMAPLYRSPGLESVAVLPFVNLNGDANADYVVDGITESLIGNLAHVPGLKVKSRSSVFRYKGQEVDLRKAGSDLGVSALASGRVTLQGDTLDVSAELTDVRDNTEIWGRHYSGKRSDLISLQEQIAGDLAEKLRSTLTSAEMQRVTKQGTRDQEAYGLYLKGRYAWNRRTYGDVETAISYFNQAITKDPEYALAYSGLADAYSVLPFFGGDPSEDSQASTAAARKALELDAGLAHPHAVLGTNLMSYDWNFAEGEREFKKAIELDPSDATAHQWYAENLSTLGRSQEALTEINRAHQLDPLSPIITRVSASVHVSARQYDEAIAVCQKLVQENPTVAIAHDCLAYGYWGKQMYRQVVDEWKTYGQLTGYRNDLEFGEALDEGYRSAGWKGAMAKAVEIRQKQRETSYASPLQIARFYAEMGDKERAFQWLDIAYREHDWLLMGLKTYFQLDSLRSDPRFAALVSKVGLPQ